MKDDNPEESVAWRNVGIPSCHEAFQWFPKCQWHASLPGASQAMSAFREAMQPLPKVAYQDLIPSSLHETMRSIRGVYNEALSGALSDFVASTRLALDTSSILRSISESLNPLYERLSSLDLALDLQGLRDGYIGWGNLGWIVADAMTFSEIRAVPQTLVEADRLCMRYFDHGGLNRLFDRLQLNSNKRKDLDEAISLFTDRRYKPCAMMLCSLIEGELIKLGGRAQGKNRRSGRVTIDKVARQISKEETLLAFEFENYSRVWAYFFRSGNDFDRSREGELNRNFLMHGMMYKPVRRKTCVKLFSLLDSTTCVLPLIAGV